MPRPKHLCVLPCGGLLPEHFAPWTSSDLAPYVHYVPEELSGSNAFKPLFDGFIFNGIGSRPGRFMYPMYAAFGAAADQSDWLLWIDSLFAPGCNLDALNSLADRPLNVWVSIPYPQMQYTNFGKLNGRELHFMSAKDRYEAVEWWIVQFLERWNQVANDFGNLGLRGFLWQRESIDKHDEPLVKMTNRFIASKGYHSLWLPQYGAYGAVKFSMLGFDDAAIHANYYGNAGMGVEWINHAAIMARSCGAGFQIICGKGILYNDTHFLDYLNLGLPEKNGYASSHLLVYQFPNQRLGDLSKKQPEDYERLYAFISGSYCKTSYPGIDY